MPIDPNTVQWDDEGSNLDFSDMPARRRGIDPDEVIWDEDIINRVMAPQRALDRMNWLGGIRDTDAPKPVSDDEPLPPEWYAAKRRKTLRDVTGVMKEAFKPLVEVPVYGGMGLVSAPFQAIAGIAQALRPGEQGIEGDVSGIAGPKPRAQRGQEAMEKVGKFFEPKLPWEMGEPTKDILETAGAGLEAATYPLRKAGGAAGELIGGDTGKFVGELVGEWATYLGLPPLLRRQAHKFVDRGLIKELTGLIHENNKVDLTPEESAGIASDVIAKANALKREQTGKPYTPTERWHEENMPAPGEIREATMWEGGTPRDLNLGEKWKTTRNIRRLREELAGRMPPPELLGEPQARLPEPIDPTMTRGEYPGRMAGPTEPYSPDLAAEIAPGAGPRRLGLEPNPELTAGPESGRVVGKPYNTIDAEIARDQRALPPPPDITAGEYPGKMVDWNRPISVRDAWAMAHGVNPVNVLPGRVLPPSGQDPAAGSTSSGGFTPEGVPAAPSAPQLGPGEVSWEEAPWDAQKGEKPQVRPAGKPARPFQDKIKPFEAKTLLSWVKSQGGIWDRSLPGETRQFIGKESGVIGLLSKKSGKTFDELAEMAKDYGWIGPDATARDFIDLLSKDVSASKQGKERVKNFQQEIDKGALKEITKDEMAQGEWADTLTKEGWKVYGPREEMAVGDIEPGDRLLIQGEEYTHVGFDKEGLAIIKDGQTFRVDVFDKLPVEAIKEGPAKEEKVDLDKLAPIQKDEQTGLFDKPKPDNFNNMVLEAARWKGAAMKADKMYGDDKAARLAHSNMTTKGDLDAYLTKKYGLDATEARDVSNELTRRNIQADMSAEVEDFRGEKWADKVLMPEGHGELFEKPKAEKTGPQIITTEPVFGKQPMKKGKQWGLDFSGQKSLFENQAEYNAAIEKAYPGLLEQITLHYEKNLGIKGHDLEDAVAAFKDLANQLRFNFPPVRTLPGRAGTETRSEQVPGSAGEVLSKGVLPTAKSKPYKVIGHGFAEDLIKYGSANYTGRVITKPSDLAVLAQVFRNPKFETLRIFYVKGEKIVGHEGITSRMPGEVALAPTRDPVRSEEYLKRFLIPRLKAKMARLEADGFWVVHNHPGGNITASPQDMAMHQKLDTDLNLTFKGGIIINGNKWGHLERRMGTDGYAYISFSENALPEAKNYDKLLMPSINHPLIGIGVNSPETLASISSALKTDEGMVTAIYLSTQNQIRGIHNVPIGIFKNYKGMVDFFRGRLREFGATNVVPVFAAGEQISKDVQQNVRTGILYGRILDVTQKGTGKTARLADAELMRVPATSFFTQESPKTLKVAEVPEQYVPAKETDKGVALYSTRGGTPTKPTLEAAKEIFKGQEVYQSPEGNIIVKTRGGQYLEIKEVEHIEPNNMALNIAYGRTLKGEEKIVGKYHEGRIELVKGRANQWLLTHESEHFMEDFGIISSVDVLALKGYIKRQVREGNFKTANKEDVGGPEDRANFIADELNNQKAKGLIARIIAKIREFIDRLINAFGKRTVQGIVRDVKSGEIYKKQGDWRKSGEPEYAVKKGPGKAIDVRDSQAANLDVMSRRVDIWKSWAKKYQKQGMSEEDALFKAFREALALTPEQIKAGGKVPQYSVGLPERGLTEAHDRLLEARKEYGKMLLKRRVLRNKIEKLEKHAAALTQANAKKVNTELLRRAKLGLSSIEKKVTAQGIKVRGLDQAMTRVQGNLPAEDRTIVKRRNLGTVDAPRYAPAITQAMFDVIKNFKEPGVKLFAGRTINPIRSIAALGEDAKDLFYYPVRTAYSNVVNEQEATFKELDAIRKKLPWKSGDRIGIYAISKQPKGMDLLNEAGITEVPTLTSSEMAAYDWMRGKLKELYTRLNDARREIGMLPFREVQDYFTFFRKFSIWDDLGLSPTMKAEANLPDIPIHLRATFFKNIKARTRALYPVEYNAWDIFRQYTGQALLHVHVSKTIALGRELLGTIPATPNRPAYLLRDEKPKAAALLTEYLDFVAGQKIKTMLPETVEKGLKVLQKNIVGATLAGNLRSFMIQPLASVNAVAMIGLQRMIQGALELASSGSRNLALEKSETLRGRIMDVSYADAIRGVLGVIGKVKGYAFQGGMWPLKFLDFLTAQATFIGAYRLAKSKGMAEDMAIRFADDIVVKSQGSGTRVDLSPIQRTTLGKAATVFQTFSINQWGQLYSDVFGMGPGAEDLKKSERLKRILYFLGGIALANTIMEDIMGVQSPFPTPFNAYMRARDQGKNHAEATYEATLELLTMLPFLGGMRYGSTPLGAVAEWISDVFKKLSPSKGFKRPAAELIMKGTGVPGTSEFWKTKRGLKQGKTLPESLLGTTKSTSPENPRPIGLRGHKRRSKKNRAIQ